MSKELHSKFPRITFAVVTAMIALATVYIIYGGNPLDISKATTTGDITILIVILVAAIICAVVAHFTIRRWFLASVASGLAFTILIQIGNYAFLGYLDPFFIIAIVIGALVGFAVATVIGIPFLILRSRQTSDEVS